MKIPVAIAFKVATDKASLENLVSQSMQIAVYCLNNNLNPIGCVLTFRSCEDILKQLKKLDNKERFEYVVIYSPRQIAKNHAEYTEFVQAVRNNYKSDVKHLRG